MLVLAFMYVSLIVMFIPEFELTYFSGYLFVAMYFGIMFHELTWGHFFLDVGHLAFMYFRESISSLYVIIPQG